MPIFIINLVIIIFMFNFFPSVNNLWVWPKTFNKLINYCFEIRTPLPRRVIKVLNTIWGARWLIFRICFDIFINLNSTYLIPQVNWHYLVIHLQENYIRFVCRAIKHFKCILYTLILCTVKNICMKLRFKIKFKMSLFV